MTFNILTIRTAEFEDGSLYPVLGDESSEIEFEPRDGKDVKSLFANRLAVHRIVGSNLEKQASVADIRASVFITDARVAVACSKYDKGGGWRGGSLAVPVLNVVSHARAAHRRRGKMLVGHIRYPWLVSVGFVEKSGMGSSDGLRLKVIEKVEGVGRTMTLDIGFPKGTDTARLAALIAQRAAQYRLTHDPELGEKELVSLTNLARGPQQLVGQPKQYTFYEMGTHFFVSSGNAYQTPRTDATPKPAARVSLHGPEPTSTLPPHAAQVRPADVRDRPPTAPVPLAAPLSSTAGAGFTLGVPKSALAPTHSSGESGNGTPPDWHDDPRGRHELRYWDGQGWTDHVSDRGVTSLDAL